MRMRAAITLEIQRQVAVALLTLALVTLRIVATEIAARLERQR